jgi:thioredoxin
MSKLRSVTTDEFDAVVLADSRPVLVDFWAEWCAPCKALAPTLEKVSQNFDGKISIVKLNVDEQPAVRDRFAVRGIPTLILINNGQEVARITGNQSTTKLSGFLDSHLGTTTKIATTAITLCAYGGTQGVKVAYVNRLREHIRRKLDSPTESMWDGDISGGLRFVTNEAQADDCARVLGVPLEVVLLVETLTSYYGTNAANAEFVADWLDRLPVGANLTFVTARFLVQILESEMVFDLLDGESALLRVRDQLLSMHIAEMKGEIIEESRWQQIQHECQDRRVLGGMLAAAGSSLKSDPDLLGRFIPSVTMSVWRQLQADCNWKSGDEARMDEIAEGIWEAARQKGVEAPRGDQLLARMEELDPTLLQRHRYHYEEGCRTMGQMGRKLGAMFLEHTSRCS